MDEVGEKTAGTAITATCVELNVYCVIVVSRVLEGEAGIRKCRSLAILKRKGSDGVSLIYIKVA